MISGSFRKAAERISARGLGGGGEGWHKTRLIQVPYTAVYLRVEEQLKRPPRPILETPGRVSRGTHHTLQREGTHHTRQREVSTYRRPFPATKMYFAYSNNRYLLFVHVRSVVLLLQRKMVKLNFSKPFRRESRFLRKTSHSSSNRKNTTETRRKQDGPTMARNAMQTVQPAAINSCLEDKRPRACQWI